MPYLPRLATFIALAALAAIGAMLFAGSGQANASPTQGLKDLVQATSPVEPVGWRYRRVYEPEYAVRDYAPNYAYSYRRYGNGHDEVRELQRLFPETNWPPSMRYHQY
jgi:hypothetical protein